MIAFLIYNERSISLLYHAQLHYSHMFCYQSLYITNDQSRYYTT